MPNWAKIVTLGIVLGLLFGCKSEERFLTIGNTVTYQQSLNPPVLDIVWVVDDRSPMYRARNLLVPQAKAFFQRLDSVPNDYQMVFTNMDQGRLQPNVILTKGLGSLEERTITFGNVISQIINLNTGAVSQGFWSSRNLLKNSFSPRENVPLVLVYLTDSDDHSTTDGSEAVEYYKKELLAFKQNKPELLKVYAINYFPVPPNAQNDTNRCATRYNADIDQPGFENRYFRLASALSGGTGDLCGNFAGQIDLSGLRLKELPKEFPIPKKTDGASLIVTVLLNSQKVIAPWTFNAANNSIVFETAPPEGSVIRITFR